MNNVIINKKKKPKIFPSHAWVTIVDFVYPVFALWFYCSQRRLNYLSSQSSDFECTWRRVFQKRVMRTKFDIFGIVLPTSVLFCYREVRPNNLSLVCLYLSLYISFLLFGHFFFDTLTQKALLYKSSRKHTICMRWKFWDFSSFV